MGESHDIRDERRRAEVLAKAAELFGSPEPLRSVTINWVAKECGIPASTILSQPGLAGDPAGSAEAFRHLLFRRMVADLVVELPETKRRDLVALVGQGASLPSLVTAVVDNLEQQFCDTVHADYLLAASRRIDDPLIAATVAEKWAEITKEPAFIIRLLIAGSGHTLDESIDDAALQAALALGLSVAYVQRKLVLPLEQARTVSGDTSFGVAALLVWSMLVAQLSPRPSAARDGQEATPNE